MVSPLLTKTAWQDVFEVLTGNKPYTWQEQAWDQLTHNQPLQIAMPTGFGKTALVLLWLLHLALDDSLSLQRRCAYVIDRRMLVDQVTTEAEIWANALQNAESVVQSGSPAPEHRLLADIARRLRQRRAFNPENSSPFWLSAWRGQRAGAREWVRDPAAPALIVGTVDMLGSRLLFRGYGDGPYWRPHYAGLLGMDTLWIIDEAHLSPDFLAMLQDAQNIQAAAPESSGVLSAVRPINIIAMTATKNFRPDYAIEIKPDLDTLCEPALTQRLNGSRSLYIHSVPQLTAIPEKMAELALAHKDSHVPVLVYVSTPQMAYTVAQKLRKGLEPAKTKHGAKPAIPGSVLVLTGEMRGWERDHLVHQKDLQRFLEPEQDNHDKTVYLVATSAGELGWDLNAHHGVFDWEPLGKAPWNHYPSHFSTWARFLQRAGRVNRRGTFADCRIDIVHSPSVEKNTSKNPTPEEERWKTHRKGEWDILNALPQVDRSSDTSSDSPPRNGTLAALLQASKTSQSPQAIPPLHPLTYQHMAAFEATSLNAEDAATLRVDTMLHGPQQAEPPTVSFIWRPEWSWFHTLPNALRVWEQWLDDFPVLPTEVLTLPYWRAQEGWSRWRDRMPQSPLLMETANGKLHQEAEELFCYARYFLAPTVGGLNADGFWDPAYTETVTVVPRSDGLRARFYYNSDDKFWHVEPAASPNNASDSFEERWAAQINDLTADSQKDLVNACNRLLKESGFKAVMCPPISVPCSDDTGDGYTTLIVGWQLRDQPSSQQDSAVFLDDHQDAATRCLDAICTALALSDPLTESLKQATAHHDDGKAEQIWQCFAGRQPGDPRPLGKPRTPGDPSVLGGYRHELHSALSPNTPSDPLVRFLIAAHHGRHRWGFRQQSVQAESRLANTDSVHAALLTLVHDAARLRYHYGPWGLAWLESLVRAADQEASAHADTLANSL